MLCLKLVVCVIYLLCFYVFCLFFCQNELYIWSFFKNIQSNIQCFSNFMTHLHLPPWTHRKPINAALSIPHQQLSEITKLFFPLGSNFNAWFYFPWAVFLVLASGMLSLPDPGLMATTTAAKPFGIACPSSSWCPYFSPNSTDCLREASSLACPVASGHRWL